ncbi:DnaB-like helicase N-terminal domain-containing protein, partial [Oceanidesulfovibrio indonesiensis]
MTQNPPMPEYVPPHSSRTEQAVLAGLSLADDKRPEVFTEVVGILDPGDFYFPAHQLIFRHMVVLHKQGAPVDPVAICESLDSAGLLESFGGRDYLANLVGSAMTCSDLPYHARVVKNYARRREMAERTRVILENAYRTSVPIEDIQAQIQELASMGGQAVAGAKPLRFLSLDEMTSEPAPIEWLVRGYLEAQTLSVLFGASNSMKSFLAN